MSQVIKAFMGVFMVLFLLVASTGVLGAFYQILHAQNTHAHMIDELENSDFARSIMEACFEIAEQEGVSPQAVQQGIARSLNFLKNFLKDR